MSMLARALLVLGTVGSVLATSKVHAVANDYDYTGSSRFAWSGVLILLLATAAYGSGLPDLVRSAGEAIRASAVVIVASTLVISAFQLVVGDALLPRFVLLASSALLLPWYVACSAIARRGRSRRELRDRVVVVSGADDVATLRDDLARDLELPALVVGHLLPGDATGANGRRPLVELVEAAAATVVVLSRAAQASDDIVHQAAELHERGLRVRTLSLFYEQWLGKLPLPELERVSLLYDISELHRALYGRVSRIVDLTLSSAGTGVLLLAIPFVLLGNVVGNRGPLFYRQPRVGKNGVQFSIVKFRTMRPSSGGERSPNEWTTEDDPRITAFGRILRRTHVDELPQLVNVLWGDLSLVGPRPEQPHYVEELTAKLPFYDLRHLVTPGLTGWAQVKYGYAGTETDALEKLQYEFYYLRHQSLSLDLRILVRTIRRVLRAAGR